MCLLWNKEQNIMCAAAQPVPIQRPWINLFSATKFFNDFNEYGTEDLNENILIQKSRNFVEERCSSAKSGSGFGCNFDTALIIFGMLVQFIPSVIFTIGPIIAIILFASGAFENAEWNRKKLYLYTWNMEKWHLNVKISHCSDCIDFCIWWLLKFIDFLFFAFLIRECIHFVITMNKASYSA